MYKNLTLTTFLGAFAIVLGAFGAHALKNKLSPTALNSFETAVRYQMYHVLVLLFVNTFSEFSIKQKNRLTLLFTIGIILFSGSIYAVYLLKIPSKFIWFVTPLGGLTFIAGWLTLTYEFLTQIIKNK